MSLHFLTVAIILYYTITYCNIYVDITQAT